MLIATTIFSALFMTGQVLSGAPINSTASRATDSFQEQSLFFVLDNTLNDVDPSSGHFKSANIHKLFLYLERRSGEPKKEILQNLQALLFKYSQSREMQTRMLSLTVKIFSRFPQEESPQRFLEHLLVASNFPDVRLSAAQTLQSFSVPEGFNPKKRKIQDLFAELFYSESDSRLKSELRKLVEKWDPDALKYGPPGLKRNLMECAGMLRSLWNSLTTLHP